MQHLLWIALLVTCVTSVFLHPTRARARLFQSADVAAASSANTFPNNLFSYFDIEGVGPYSILGYNSAKVTYPPSSGNGLVSSSSFAIDPVRKRLVFNQGESGNQYVFSNGTYITLNVSGEPNTPFLCTYIPYVNYSQEVLAVNNITLQDIFYELPSQNTQSSTQSSTQNQNQEPQQVKLYSGIMVDASSCGTMISFSVATTHSGHIRGIYAAEPFPFAQFHTPTGAAVVSSALIFDDTTIVNGVPDASFFQLPPSCFQANLVNYCAATGYSVPPTALCNLFPPIHS